MVFGHPPSAGPFIPWQDIDKTSSRPKVSSRAETSKKRLDGRSVPLGYSNIVCVRLCERVCVCVQCK